jgi:murein DD-endopeptidase MepM/ murein hydrolase activator NlpD
MTGMAGGDHLHFTMLVNGQMVNPVEWWDQHWIDDRILRKLHAAAGS